MRRPRDSHGEDDSDNQEHADSLLSPEAPVRIRGVVSTICFPPTQT